MPRLEWLEDRWLPSSSVVSTYLQTPLSFVANQGQTDPSVAFLSQGSGYTLFLTANGAVLSLQQPPGGASAGQSAVITMQLDGANAAPVISGVDKLAGVSNYFVGNNPGDWQTKVPNYGKVSYQNLYPGVDAVFYGTQRQLEYDFDVAPGANPGVIQLSFQGQQSMSLDAQGNLVLNTAGGDVVEDAPVVYQTINGVRRSVTGRFVIENANQVGFAIGAYDTTQPLTIDPMLSYSSFLGGSGADTGVAAATDSAGNLYIVGSTSSQDFPEKNEKAPLTTKLFTSGEHVFVTEINAASGSTPAGTQTLYSTYYGGTGTDIGTSIAIDSLGDVIVAGSTTSFNLPTGALGFTSAPFFGENAFQEFNGGTANAPEDGFVFKLTPSGSSLNFSTYIGGGGNDQINAVAVNNNDIFLTGTTFSSNFPITSGAKQPVIAGQGDAFLFMLSPDGVTDDYSTYIGGSGNDVANAIALDSAGNVYIAGQTNSVNFPTVGPIQSTLNGATSAFLMKIYESAGAADGTIAYSTYLGGPGNSVANSLLVDGSGDAYLTGSTSSSDFPTAGNPFQPTFQGNGQDAFVSEVNPSGTDLVFSTYLSGTGGQIGTVGNGIILDSAGDPIVVGTTDSATFPTLLPIQRNLLGTEDAFVTKFTPDGSALDYSTYLGGEFSENPTTHALTPAFSEGLGIAYTSKTPDAVYLVGETDADDFTPANQFAVTFPTFAPGGTSIQGKFGGATDAFVAQITQSDEITALNGSTDTLTVEEGTRTLDITVTGIISTGILLEVNGSGLPTDTFLGGLGSYAVAQIPTQDLANPGVLLVNAVESPIMSNGVETVQGGISNQLRLVVVDAPLVDTTIPMTYTTTEGQNTGNVVT